MPIPEKSILFIDDDVPGSELAAYNLISAGYSVDLARDGDIGLKMFARKHYDLVITDVQMPGISGLRVISSIRQKSSDVPIIVMTAFANVGIAVTAMRSGANDFINKPFSRDQILSSVKQTLHPQ